MDDKEKADAFLKDIDEVSAKHNLYLGISQPQFIIQPKRVQTNSSEVRVDLEKLPTEELQKMVEKYQSVSDKATINVQLIKAEITKRNA